MQRKCLCSHEQQEFRAGQSTDPGLTSRSINGNFKSLISVPADCDRIRVEICANGGRMTKSKSFLAVVVGGLALSACAINALRTDYAGKVGSQGQLVAAGATQFLDRVDEARTKVSVEMIAADPACGNSPALFRNRPSLDQPAPGWLCAYPGTGEAAATSSLSLRPIAPELEPTLETIAALSAYSEALSEIVDADIPDAAKPLNDALALARAAEGTLRALAGGTAIVPAADDKRLTAITGFISFLGQLRGEADHVRAIREVIIANPQGAAPIIAALREHLELFNNQMRADDGLRSGISGALLRRVVDARPPLASDARRKAAETYYSLAQTARASGRIYPALGNALNKLEEADSDLRRVLVDNPRLTAKERRRISELNRQRVIDALNHITAVITAFRGV
jgi:hypothetical protein